MLKKMLDHYNDNELKIIISLLDQEYNGDYSREDMKKFILLDDVIILNRFNIDDFIYMINEFEKIEKLIISDNESFKKIENYNLPICKNIVLFNLNIDNIINDFLNKNCVEYLSIIKSTIDTEYIENHDLKYLDISKNHIKKLNSIISNSLIALHIDNLDKEFFKFNIDCNNIDSLLLRNCYSNFIKPIKFIQELNIHNINKNIDMDLRNISTIGALLINNCNVNTINLDHNIKYDIYIQACKVNSLYLNSTGFNKNHRNHNIFVYSSEIYEIDRPMENYESSFLNYYKNIIKKAQNPDIDDKTRFELLKIIKKYKDYFINNDKNIMNIVK